MKAGWVRLESTWWENIAASMTASGQPWCDDAVLQDLRFWADIERTGQGRRPGRPSLCERWNRQDGYAVRRLMRSEEEWRDPMSTSQRPASTQPATGQQPARVATFERQISNETSQQPARTQPATSQDPAPRALLLHSHDHSHDHEQQEGGASPPAAASEKSLDTSGPDWTPVVRTDEQLAVLSGSVLSEITRTSVAPTTPPKALVSWLEANASLSDDEVLERVELLSAACRHAPGHPWADKIRGEGWKGRLDWSRKPTLVLDMNEWAYRYGLARAWHEDGRPGQRRPQGQVITMPKVDLEAIEASLEEHVQRRSLESEQRAAEQEAQRELEEEARQELLVELSRAAAPAAVVGTDLKSRGSQARRSRWLTEREDLENRLRSGDRAVLVEARRWVEAAEQRRVQA